MITRIARRVLPHRLKRLVKRSGLRVRHRSAATNVYHCCVQKTASQWIRRILSDQRVYQYCGLKPYDHNKTFPKGVDLRKLTDVTFEAPMPPRTIVTPLYTAFDGFVGLPKPETYRAFFVMRDPRDIIVSWYFSMRNSHPTMGGTLSALREKLGGMSRHEGIRHSIYLLSYRTGLFEALGSWAGAADKDRNVMLVKYEDLTAVDSSGLFKRLLAHCDIALPDDVLAQLLEENSFERLSGRQRGQEDKRAHLRKGAPGDWANHFDDELLSYFELETGDLMSRLGYA